MRVICARYFRDVAPWLLLSVFLFISLVTVFTQAYKYGITGDEPLQQLYGKHVLAWYHSHGNDTSFMTALPSTTHMPEHGGIFDAVIAAAQSQFRATDPWLVRHVVTGLSGWLGVVAIALCGFELGGPWVGFVAALGLWLYPRYYGAIYNNPKDIPATVSLTFVLWVTLLLLKYSKRFVPMLVASVLLGCCMGVATAIRVTAITWYGVLIALVAGWWSVNGRRAWRESHVVSELARQALAGGIVAASWLLSTIACWPFIFLNPRTNLVESIQLMSRYPWDGRVLFNGVAYPATQLPASYVPTWLVIGSPPMLLVLLVVGLLMAGIEAARTRRINPAVGTTALAFVIPLASLLLLHPVLYDSLRQFLYVIPPLILLAAYGLVRAVSLLMRQRRVELRWMAAALLSVTIASYALVVADMVALSPFEYIYFSPLVGGLKGAAGTYDTDYYGTCSKAAAEWLSHNYQRYTPSPTLDTSILVQGSIASFLPAAFRTDNTHPDFFVGITRNNENLKYPTYHVIHVVAAEGVPLCVVKTRFASPRNA